MKIAEKKEQPLLKRTVVKGFVGFEASTPSRAELRKRVSDALKVDENKVAVCIIKTKFGEKRADFEAHIYASPEALDKSESVVVLRRHGLRAKKEKAAKQATKAA